MSEKVIATAVESKLEEQYKRAIDDLKMSYQDHVNRLEDKIIAQNSNVSEAAINKLLKLLNPALLLFGGFVVVFSFLGYEDLRESVRSMAKTKVNAWLSYDEKNSPINEDILSIRDRYLVDSVSVRYLRSKAETNRHSYFKITDKELADLIRIANDKNTSLKDYSDILNIYGSSFVLGSIKFRGDYQGGLFSKIFTEGGFKEKHKKQREFLSVFSHDMSIYSIAREQLDNKNEYHQLGAYKAVANINPLYAVEHANKNLTADSFKPIDSEMALTLVRYDAESGNLKKYIDRLYDVRRDLNGWLYQYIDIFSGLTRNESKIYSFELRNRKSDQVRDEMALDIFQKLVEDEYSIIVGDGFGGGRLLLSKSGGSSTVLSQEEAGKIYKNSSLLNKLIRKNSSSVEWLGKVVSTLEVFYEEEYLVTVMADLGDTTSITLTNNQIIAANDVLGSVWFTVDRNVNNRLEVAYRDRTGELSRHAIAALKNAENSKFSYRYVEKDLHAFVERMPEQF